MKKLLIICTLLLVLSSAFAARKALVMANWNYTNSTLNSPKADADSIAKVLGFMGFSIVRFDNLSISAFNAAVDSFAVKIAPTDEVLVYYSGHGISYNNLNYLVPANTDMGKSQLYNKTAYSVNLLANKIKAAKTSIILLEASRSWVPTGTKSAFPKSFAAMTAVSPKQVIITSAEPGKTVQNSNLSYSLFTQAFLSQISFSEEGLNVLFPKLGTQMFKSSGNVQKPWRSGTLETDFTFITNEIKAGWKGINPMRIEGGGSLSW